MMNSISAKKPPYTIHDQRVMVDSDLAKLYGIETRTLNQAVKRNLDRFPEDFLSIPNSKELVHLRSQIVILGELTSDNHVFKHPPYLFTENGVAMLSSVLRSKQAIQVNISIMRTFTKLRSYLSMDNFFEKEATQLFKIVFERLDSIEAQITQQLPKNRKKIGLKE